MAQGGWQAGSYHNPSAVEYDSNAAYNFQQYAEPQQYQQFNQQDLPNVSQASQQVFSEQAYYQPQNPYGSDMHQQHHGDLQGHSQTQMPIYADPHFQRSSATFSQFAPTNQPQHVQSHTHGLPDESWQTTPQQQQQPQQQSQQQQHPHQPLTYGHQPLPYDAQRPRQIYQAIQASPAPATGSPGPGQTHSLQYTQPQVQAQAPPNLYQNAQGQLNPRTSQAQPSPQPSPQQQQQFRYPYQYPGGDAVNGATHAASTPPPQTMANAQNQPRANHSQAQFAAIPVAVPSPPPTQAPSRIASKAAQQQPIARASHSPAVPGQPVHPQQNMYGYVPSPSGAVPLAHQNILPQPSGGSPAVASNTGPFPPQGFNLVDGTPNLSFIDGAAEKQMVTAEHKKMALKHTPYVAKTNAADGPLLPERKRRLPAEIQRDWEAVTTVLQTATLNDHQRKEVNLKVDALQKEMKGLTGKTIDSYVPKKRTRKPKEAKPSAGPGAESDDSSQYSSDEEDEIDREARQIRNAPPPPENTLPRIEQEVVKIVWQDPDAPPTSENPTATAIQAFGSFVDGLWSKFKKLKDNVKAAGKANDSAKAKQYQAELDQQIGTIRTAVESANKFAEDRFIENAGGNRKLVSILRNALQYSWASKDFNGPFPKALLQFLSGITTMGSAFVVGTLKMDDLRQKYGQELDKEGRQQLDLILSNSKAHDKQVAATSEPSAEVKREVPGAASKKPAVVGAKDAAPVPSKVLPVKKEVAVPKKPSVPEVKKMTPINYSGLGSARRVISGSAAKAVTTNGSSPTKRPRDDDVDSRVAKKPAVEGVAGAPSTSSASSSASNSSGASSTVSLAKPKTSGSILPGKSRPVVKTPAKRPEPPASSGFSAIGGLLAEIAKPKEAPKPREETPKAPETEEEKARRIRKQARKQLRVRWKPDSELADYRIFEHDSAEDEGRASDMVRDAHDSWSEGQMLKRGVQEEDEDDESKQSEVALRPWSEPPSVDFRGLDASRREKNFDNRGGVQRVETDEQKYMADYESRVLMAIYTTPGEIPDTPRSPSRNDTQGSSQPKVATLPSDTPKLQEIHRRWTESGQIGHTATLRGALQRIGVTPAQHNTPTMLPSSKTNVPRPAAPSRPLTREERDKAVLELLSSGNLNAMEVDDGDSYDPEESTATQRRHDYPDPKVQAAADAIESVVDRLRGKAAGLTEPPEWLSSDASRVKEWWTGYNNDVAAKAAGEASERAKRFSEEHARHAAQQPQAAATAFGNGSTTDGSAAQWAAYYAQLQQQQQQYQQPQAPAQQDQSIASILQQVQALQSGQPQPQPAPQQQAVPAQQTGGADVHALLAALGQSAQPTPAPQAAAQPAGSSGGEYEQNAAWAAWYASQYAGQNQGQAAGSYQQQKPADASQDPNAAWAAYFAQMAGGGAGQQPQQQQSQQHSGDSERGNRQDSHGKRDRDRASRAHGNNVNQNRANRDSKHINRALIGTKPCSFWAKGQCAKGDECTFRHDPNDLK